MWRVGVVSVLSALCVTGTALAQTGRIAGRVTSAEGSVPVGAAQVTLAVRGVFEELSRRREVPAGRADVPPGLEHEPVRRARLAPPPLSPRGRGRG